MQAKATQLGDAALGRVILGQDELCRDMEGRMLWVNDSEFR